MHEAQMHKYNCMLTLTYNDEHLPSDLSLRYQHWQAFMRRLRKALGRGKKTIRHQGSARFYLGGEYGPLYGRPHYHACLFGVDFADQVYHSTTRAGEKIYTSQTLDQLWGKGFASIGNITFQSAAYIARYIMKKRTGDKNKTTYEILDPETGEIHFKKKEFNNMSRRPGIGSTWYDKYQDDVHPQGKVVVRGHQQNTPRYYDNKFKHIDKLAHEHLKYLRHLEAIAHAHDQTDERLAVQETVALAKTRSLTRTLE